MASKAIGFLNFKFSADLSNFERAMKKAQKNLNKFGKNITKTGQTLTRNLTLPIAGFGLASLKFGSDLQETSSKFSQVFSSLRVEAEKTSKEFQKSFGLSELSAKGMLSSTGDLLVGFGFTEKAALELSDQVNRLSVDLASFSNFEGGAKGASRALTKALVGETESAKALGIVIRQGTKDYKNRTEAIMKEQGVTILQAKAINNLEIAYSQSQKAIGDYARTSGDFANQLRFLQEQFIDLSSQLGQKIIPLAQKVLTVFKNLTSRFQDLSSETKDNIISQGLLLAAIGPVLIIFGKLAFGLSSVIGVVKMLGIAFKGLFKIMLKNPFIAVGALLVGITLKLTFFSRAAIEARKNQEKFIEAFNKRTEQGKTKSNILERVRILKELTKEQKINLIQDIKDQISSLENSKLQLKLTSKRSKEIQKLRNEITKLREVSKQETDDPLQKAINASLPANIERIQQKIAQLQKEISGGKTIKGFNMDIDQMNNLLLELSKNTDLTDDSLNNLNNLLLDIENNTNNVNNELKDFTKVQSKIAEAPLVWDTYGLFLSDAADQFKDIIQTGLQFNKTQALINQSFKMFGDVVGNSMNEAIESQESFFSVFIKNIKRAIRSLLIQLAVLTLIKVLMGDSRAFSVASIRGSLGEIMNVPAFAEGGLVTSPTTALIGEGIGTNAGNPEVVAPLNKLKQFMGGGNNNIVVTGKLVGNDIYLSNQNASINRRRTV